MDTQAALQWIAFGEKIITAGAGVLADVKAAAAANGVEADTAALDAVIADDVRRKALAEEDATR